MKKGTVIGLLLAVLSLIALGALALWLAISMQPILSPNGTSASLLMEEDPVIIIYDEEQAKKKQEQSEVPAASTTIRDVKCEEHEEETAAPAAGAPSYIWEEPWKTMIYTLVNPEKATTG